MVVFTVIFTILSSTLTKGFQDLENRDVQDDVTMSMDTLDGRISELAIKLSDWTQWDDSYTFVQDQNQTYIETNLQVSSLTLLKLNFIVFLDERGDIIFKKFVDREGNELPFPSGLEKYFSTLGPLSTGQASQDIIKKGIVVTSEGAFTVVSNGITSSDGTAPMKGRIAFGYLLDNAAVNQLAMIGLKVSHASYGADPMPADFVEPERMLSKDNPIFAAKPQSPDVIAGYAFIPDIFGAPGLMLKVEANRPIYAQGQAVLALLKKIMFIVAFVFMAIISLLFEFLVLRRLAGLSAEITKIDARDKKLIRLPVSGKDEIALLVNKINKMLENINVAEGQKEGLEDALLAEGNRLKERNLFLENIRKASLNILEDVAESESKLSQKTVALEKQTEQYESILGFLKSIGDGVVATDLEGKIIFFNEAAERLFGQKSGDVFGKDVSQVKKLYSEKNPEKTVEVTHDSLRTGKSYNSESQHYFILRQDGSQLPVSFSVSPIFNKEKKMQGAIAVYRDVAEEREIEKTKDNFLSVAAHQLRTPLAGIRWTIESLLDGDAGKISKEAKNYLEQISENNQRLVDLVNDLLDVSRINMGKAQEEAVPINICKMLQEVADSQYGMAKERGITISFEKVCALNPDVKSAPKHLFQALENLISNSIKYTPKGGNIIVAADFEQEEVIISVADNGIGIPKEDQVKIFTKFFRASNAVLKETEGSGLGLNVVKSFIEEAGGKIRFESVEGKGTTFFITLPAYKAK